MKITKATHYPDMLRTVIVVVLNPDDPEVVHADGSAHTEAAPPGKEGLNSWTWCHDCRYNWKKREFIWDKEQLKKEDSSGEMIDKTDADLLAEIVEILAVASTPTAPVTLTSIVGNTF
jgi:hypothetical protein